MCFSALIQANINYLSETFEADIDYEAFNLLDRLTLEEPKNYKKWGSDNRIFHYYYAPVISLSDNKKVIKPMRYGIYPPAYMKTGGAPIYNARKDKLTTPFWKDMITSSRCFVVISAFSEWVNVSDYVKSGYATIDEIQDYFEGELEAKKTKASEKGKKYTLSKTDKTPAINRKIMPTFKLKESMEVIAPAVYNKSDNKPFYGFAIITDTPYKEVLNSGHNRSPLLIDKQAADDYLKGASLLKRVDGGLSVYL